jgi:hypothetical protein
MPLKATDPATQWREIDDWEGGTGWIAYPEETMERASHVLDGPEGLWLVDPVDFDGLDEFLADRGDVRGTVVLLNRHKRDAASVARRHDVSVHVPHFMNDAVRDLDAPVEPVRTDLPDSEYGVHRLVDNPLWKEAVLYGEESGTLVVPEAVGTTGYFRTSDERLGVHPALRFKPPRKLGRLTPERILVGHGAGVFEDAERALQNALEGARRRTPRLYANNLREFLP